MRDGRGWWQVTQGLAGHRGTWAFTWREVEALKGCGNGPDSGVHRRLLASVSGTDYCIEVVIMSLSHSSNEKTEAPEGEWPGQSHRDQGFIWSQKPGYKLCSTPSAWVPAHLQASVFVPIRISLLWGFCCCDFCSVSFSVSDSLFVSS